MAGVGADARCSCHDVGPQLRAEGEVMRELAPVLHDNIDRHLSLAQEWMPHDYVPWGRGRDFDELPWEPGQSTLSPDAQIAFELNLLTEDNLPSYHRDIAVATAPFGAGWTEWAHRWTAEEARHSIVMRDYLMVCRGVDPVALERGRMVAMTTGWSAQGASPLAGLTYVAFQELATRISHRNTGRLSGDPVAERLLARIAADENLHMVFYRNLVDAAVAIDPSLIVRAVTRVVLDFQMPGTDIPDYLVKAMKIARAGIYDMRIHVDDVLAPQLRHWRLFELGGLTPEAEQDRDVLAAHLTRLDALATRYEERRAARAALTAARAS